MRYRDPQLKGDLEGEKMCEINHITIIIKNQLNIIKSRQRKEAWRIPWDSQRRPEMFGT